MTQTWYTCRRGRVAHRIRGCQNAGEIDGELTEAERSKQGIRKCETCRWVAPMMEGAK